MVNLTRIYTRTGDAGQTRLSDMSLTSKTDLRLEAYATADEANAVIGVALAQGELDEAVVKVLTRIQTDLFDVGADLATPAVEQLEYPHLRIEPEYIVRRDGWCDEFNGDLENPRSLSPKGEP